MWGWMQASPAGEVGDGGGLVVSGLGAAGWVVAGWVVAGRRRQRRPRPGGGGLGSSESVGCCLCHVERRKRSYSREVWGAVWKIGNLGKVCVGFGPFWTLN